jgi:hypothetical protein
VNCGFEWMGRSRQAAKQASTQRWLTIGFSQAAARATLLPCSLRGRVVDGCQRAELRCEATAQHKVEREDVHRSDDVRVGARKVWREVAAHQLDERLDVLARLARVVRQGDALG